MIPDHSTPYTESHPVFEVPISAFPNRNDHHILLEMNATQAPRDDGHTSKYLVHWTGRKGERPGLENLSAIARTCRLRLSQNMFFFDGALRVVENMACFTDVPLWHSLPHCQRYGRYAIVFDKAKLMARGAQPVFYFTHVFKRDMSTIYNFIISQMEKATIPSEIFEATHRHFFYAQEFSAGSVTDPTANYYEREWRLGEFSLIPESEDVGAYCYNHRLPLCIGRSVKDGSDVYFVIDPKDVAFLVAPKDHVAEVDNPHSFAVHLFEDVVSNEEE